MPKNDIGLIGLAVMGQNLALNMARNGFGITVYNRTAATTRKFMDRAGTDAGITAADDLEAFTASLAPPRRMICMVKAGAPVDAVIDRLANHLAPGDIIMDGGNSLFTDTQRRAARLEEMGLKYMGVGISGGEEGALKGPSIMPGGDRESWRLVKPILTAIAARADGEACVAYMGAGGAGHFVKMVHNGIEYGDMQLIAESYALLQTILGMTAAELAAVFEGWRQGGLSSYLIDITADIFRKIDADTGRPLVDLILDTAGQKGTGRWTSQSALELGVSVPTLTAAVDARLLSSMKAERTAAAEVLPGPGAAAAGDRADFIARVGDALYAAKICSYAQGFALLRAADQAYDFGLNPGEVARVWKAGCIIRARFLDDVRKAFAETPDIPNLLMAAFFSATAGEGQQALRQVVAEAALAGVAVPALSASLAYYDAYRSARLPANLLQAQRDYFGAHTYRRTDKEGVFHTDWQK
ncbi:MAG: NADP-dependent phosphogluconate dehydrogenase [Desulfobacterales bacterium]|jgi:6-phosphogluconate dehydrogenase